MPASLGIHDREDKAGPQGLSLKAGADRPSPPSADAGCAGWTSPVLALSASTPTQVVPLDVEPSGVRVFVDGQPVPGAPASLTLRSDRPHVVHLERDGHQAQQIILETRKTGSGTRLEPAAVRARLEPVVPKERQVTIEGAD